MVKSDAHGKLYGVYVSVYTKSTTLYTGTIVRKR